MRKAPIPKQTINLANYRIATEQSTHSAHTNAPYQPQFIFEMLNSKQSADSRRGEVAALSEQRFERVLNDLNKSGSSVYADKHMNELEEQRKKFAEMKLENLGRIERYKEENEQLMVERDQLEEKCFDLKQTANQLRQALLAAQQECQKLKTANKHLEESYDTLKKRMATSEYNLKVMKENRDLAGKVEPRPDRQQIREVYDSVEQFLKSRVEEFTKQLKAHRMNTQLETVLENFLQELLHVNYISVNNFKRHSKSVYQTEMDLSHDNSSTNPVDNPLVLLNVEKFRLDKSLERLRNIDKKEGWQTRPNNEPSSTFMTYNKRSREPEEQDTQFRTSLSVLGPIHTQDRASRSKSKRRRIFD